MNKICLVMFVEAFAPPAGVAHSAFRALRRALAGLVALAFALSAGAQGPFQNLGFESGGIVPVRQNDPDEIEAAAALPGWSVYYGTSAESAIGYNQASMGDANVSLLSGSYRHGAPQGLIQGRYYLLLQEGAYGSSPPGDPPPWATVSVAQNAQVPASALSLTFQASLSQFTVSFDGTVLPLEVLQANSGYDVYECDISPWAGQSGQLKFTAEDTTVYLDNICFSSIPVPEPAGWGLFALAAVLLWRVRFLTKPPR